MEFNTLEDLYAIANQDKKEDRQDLRWFHSSSGYVELVIKQSDAVIGMHQGACDDDIAYLIKLPYIKIQLDKYFNDPELAKKVQIELKEYFFDSDFDPECEDMDNNRIRLTWIACGDVVDNKDED